MGGNKYPLPNLWLANPGEEKGISTTFFQPIYFIRPASLVQHDFHTMRPSRIRQDQWYLETTTGRRLQEQSRHTPQVLVHVPCSETTRVH